jgi:hypothetical protein
VEPVSTEWFGFYAPGQAEKEITLEEMRIYNEVRLFLKASNFTIFLKNLFIKLSVRLHHYIKHSRPIYRVGHDWSANFFRNFSIAKF